jgi:hypothetical protein
VHETVFTRTMVLVVFLITSPFQIELSRNQGRYVL